MEIVAGQESGVELRVTEADTAQALGSGDVPVLATPKVVALAEAACVAVTVGRLGPGRTSVGTRVELTHLAPTPVGGRVWATARVESAEGRRLVFSVRVSDGVEVVAEGTVERVVVDREKFVAKALA
ncbi:hotdog domain-containing protein [Phytomonospora sp. NPDC050363]|uniref:thioesterase family protein n=1 Tax=Phytomonospora sp. NPDC050363 TaxID=3155642 RepID=UPI0033CD6C5D